MAAHLQMVASNDRILADVNYLINYADLAFYEARKQNSLSGIEMGFDAVIQYRKEHIDKEFFTKNELILSQKRGAGYWLWKPYFIAKTLQESQEGDIVFYSDAGSQFINHKPLDSIIKKLKQEEFNLFAFEMAGHHKEHQYCRKDAARKILGAAAESEFAHGIYNSDQRMASFVIAKKTDYSLEIINKWLELGSDPQIIMDAEPQENEFQGFIDHRHDQAIWSILTKSLRIPALPDPTQWGLQHQQTQEKDFFIKHRRR